MGIRNLALLAIGFALISCGGGGGSNAPSSNTPTEPTTPPSTWRPEVNVVFPPSEGVYSSNRIPVRGTATPFIEGARIIVEGGDEESEASLREDGTWLVDSVSLGGGISNTLTVKAVDGEEVVWEQVVSELRRFRDNFQASNLAYDAENRRLFFANPLNGLLEYQIDSEEVRQIAPIDANLGNAFEMLYFPATGEVLRVIQPLDRDCVVHAIHPDTGESREFYSRPPTGPEGFCGNNELNFTLDESGDTLYIVDATRQEIVRLSPDGEILSRIEFSLSLSGIPIRGLDIHVRARTGQLLIHTLNRTSPGIGVPVQVQLFEVNRETGAVSTLWESDTFGYAGGQTTNSILVGDTIYATEEGRYRALGLASPSLEWFHPGGYVAHTILDLVPDGDSNAIYVLDHNSNLSRHDLDADSSTVFYTTNPYSGRSASPLYSFSNGSDFYLLRDEFRAANGCCDLFSIGWSNLYAYNPSDYSLRQVLATPAEVGAEPARYAIEDDRHSIGQRDTSLFRYDRETGESADLSLDYVSIGDIDHFIVGPNGRYLVILADYVVSEIDLRNETEVRRQLSLPEELRSDTLRVMARATGENGGVYIASTQGPGLFRLNFTTQTIDEASGPNVGSGPLPGGIYGMSITPDGQTAWLDVRNVFEPVWRIDLQSGDRTVFLETETPGGGAALQRGGLPLYFEPTDALYLPAREEFPPRLYHVDPVTAARVELPMRFKDAQ